MFFNLFKLIFELIAILLALVILGFVVVLILSQVWMRTREGKIAMRLSDLKKKLKEKVDVAEDDILELARSPENRSELHQLFREYKRVRLFPRKYLTIQAQAESELAYWLLGPNALKEVPAIIDNVETLRREIWGKPGDFLVFRFQIPSRRKDGGRWIVGIAGPFFSGEKPYRTAAQGFAMLGWRARNTTSSDLLDLYLIKRGQDAAPVAPMDDPVYGDIEFSNDMWACNLLFAPVGTEIGIGIVAGNEGPTRAQREFYRRIEKEYPELLAQYGAQFVIDYGPEVAGVSIEDLFSSLELKGILISAITKGPIPWEMYFETDLNPHNITAHFMDLEYKDDFWDG